jgi:hypothetical protein
MVTEDPTDGGVRSIKFGADQGAELGDCCEDVGFGLC